MDTLKTGKFLQDLRLEHNLTQEELGEQLGVTNKTISRWETGTYLPPVDILLRLADIYNVTVNEILSGERLATADYQPKAEENIVTSIKDTSVVKLRSKRILAICLAVILALAIVGVVLVSVMVSGNRYIVVTFDSNGGSDVEAYCIDIKSEPSSSGLYFIKKPSFTTKSNYSLTGWYTSLDEDGKKWDFENDAITTDITLYAKWEPATDGVWYGPYTYNSSDGGQSVSGYAVEGNSLKDYDVDVIIPSYVDGEPVIAITREAFKWCENIRSVTIPDTVRYISGDAFCGSSITDVKFGNKVECIDGCAFLGCHNLIKIDLPDSLITIGKNAFSFCVRLQNVVIPNKVVYIGERAFDGCSDLTSVTLGASLMGVDYSAFAYCNSLLEVHDMSQYFNASANLRYFPNAISIYEDDAETTNLHLDDNGFLFYDYFGDEPQLVKYYGKQTVITLPEECNGKPYTLRKYAFEESNISEITICGIDTVTYGAFEHCTNLTKVTFGDGVINIGRNAFCLCTKLKQVTMSDTIELIDVGAFSYCKLLVDIKFSSDIKRIEKLAFSECYALDVLALPGNLGFISPLAFQYCNPRTITMEQGNSNYHVNNNCLIETSSKTLILGCGSCEIPSDGSVTTITGCAFYGNSYVTNVRIPKTVEHIGYGVFNGCSSLTEITVDDENPNYKSVNNCLISVNDKQVITIAPNGIIPDDGSVTSIGIEVLTLARDRNEYLPASVTITVPKCIVEIDKMAFSVFNSYYGDPIVRLKYDGTMNECYNNTEYGKNVARMLSVICIECTDGEILPSDTVA